MYFFDCYCTKKKMNVQSSRNSKSTCTVSPALEKNYCYREKQLRVMNPCGHKNITQICNIQPFKKDNQSDCYDRFISLCWVHGMHQHKNRENPCILPKKGMLEWCVCEDFFNQDRKEKQWYECECFHNYYFLPYHTAKKHEKAKNCNCDCEEVYRKKCQLFDTYGNFKYKLVPCEIQKDPLNTDFKFNCSGNPITSKHPNRTIVPCELEGVDISTIPATINLGPASVSSKNYVYTTTASYEGTSSKSMNHTSISLSSPKYPYTPLNSTNFEIGKTVGYGSIPLVIFAVLGMIYLITKRLGKRPYAPVLTFNEDDKENKRSKVSFAIRKYKSKKYNKLSQDEDETASLLHHDERELLDSDDDLIIDI